jgi:flagellin-specific chaperone FliS
MNPQTAKSVYREIDIQGATPLQIVVALYDAILQDIRGAMAAQKHNDIEVAKNLDRFYSMIRGKLLEASIKASADAFSAIADLVVPIRSAWNEAATEQLRQQHRESERDRVPDAIPPPAAADEAVTHSGWTA